MKFFQWLTDEFPISIVVLMVLGTVVIACIEVIKS